MKTTRQEWLCRELEKAQREFEHRVAHEVVAGTLRNTLIKQALDAGVKQADIARITGLSRERVRQLR